MLSNEKFQNGVDFYHRLNFVFNLAIAVPLVPFTLLYLGNIKSMVPAFELIYPTDTVIDVLTTGLLVLIGYRSITRFQAALPDIRRLSPLRAKLVHYHQGLTNLYLGLALAGFCAILGFLMTQSKIHIVTFVLILVVFSLKRPSLKRLVEELILDEQDASVLRNRSNID